MTTENRPVHAETIEFTAGFETGLAMWATGCTFEQIAAHVDAMAPESYPRSRGLKMAGEALAGWLDDAERCARFYGHTRESAHALVQTARGA